MSNWNCRELPLLWFVRDLPHHSSPGWCETVELRGSNFGGKSRTQTEDYLKQLPIQIMPGFATRHFLSGSSAIGRSLIGKEGKIDFLESLWVVLESIFWVSDLMVTKYTFEHANYTLSLTLSLTHSHTHTHTHTHTHAHAHTHTLSLRRGGGRRWTIIIMVIFLACS